MQIAQKCQDDIRFDGFVGYILLFIAVLSIFFNEQFNFCAGGSLSRLLSRFGSFQNTVILKYTRQILMALAYLHDYGCLHRDIKGKAN